MTAGEAEKVVHVARRHQFVATAIKSVLGWLARTVVLGCVWVIVARTHGRATWNLNQLLKVEVIDQSVGWLVPPAKGATERAY